MPTSPGHPRRRRAHLGPARAQRAVAQVRSRRARRSRQRRSVPRSVLVLVALALLGAIGIGLGGQVAFAIITTDVGALPQARPLNADSIVTDSAGNVIAELHPQGETRLPVALEQVSHLEQVAIVDIEDKGFWSEGPVDVPRMVASAISDIRHDSASQGASTIPMQLAKVLYLTDDKSFAYKLRQIGYAGNIVSSLNKHDILEAYLNDIFFGEGATGIEAASHVYFGIPASKLDLAQAAMLAGLPNSPTADDPLQHPRAAAARQHYVLQTMVNNGDITEAQADQAVAEQLTYAGPQVDNLDTDPAFVAMLANQVRTQLHVDPYTAGLRITSTLDTSLQSYAEQTVHDQVVAVRRLNVGDGALVSVVPQTGAVVAYVGSAGVDSGTAQIDMASRPRQPGSTFKLFTYSTAFAERKVTMVTPVLDGPLRLPTGGGSDGTQPWQPLDYDRTWHGILPVAQAFPNSLNIPAIRTELYTGIPDILATARNFGVTTLDNANSSYGPSMTLGTYPIPLWEMAQAVTVFADQGRLHPLTFVSSVRDQANRELYRGDNPHQVMDPGAVYIVNQILTNDRNRALEFGLGSDLTLAGHLVSAKTGTSEDFKDNLTIGWTPQLATATWVGNADDSAMHGTTGITGAAPIWHQFMTHALHNVPDGWPGPPKDVYTRAAGGYSAAAFLTGTTPQTGGSALLGGRSTTFGGGDGGGNPQATAAYPDAILPPPPAPAPPGRGNGGPHHGG
ncbi:MAG: transglycosylase domain-containing protein [Candidatus Dormibacteria bacterium]